MDALGHIKVCRINRSPPEIILLINLLFQGQNHVSLITNILQKGSPKLIVTYVFWGQTNVYQITRCGWGTKLTKSGCNIMAFYVRGLLRGEREQQNFLCIIDSILKKVSSSKPYPKRSNQLIALQLMLHLYAPNWAENLTKPHYTLIHASTTLLRCVCILKNGVP